MLKRYPYFRAPVCADGTPAPACLTLTVEREARFEEVDLMGVVWHGHYASYFEDARVALTAKYGIGYETMMRERTPAPVKQIYVGYMRPLRFAQKYSITAALHWSEAARMNLSYVIRTLDGAVCADGYTVQLFTAPDGELLLEQPDFYHAFCTRWKNGAFSKERL